MKIKGEDMKIKSKEKGKINDEKENELTALIHSFLDDPLYAFPFFRLMEEGKIRKNGMESYVEEIKNAVSIAKSFITSNKRRIYDFEEKVEEDPYYVDWEIIREGGRNGFLSFTIPKEFGGRSMFSCPYTFFIEEMSSVSAGIANIFGAHALGLTPLLLSPYMLSFTWAFREVVKNSENTRPALFAFALTEPTGGSDIQQDEIWIKKAKITTHVEKANGGYILRGRKVFISDGAIAKYITVFAEREKGNPQTLMCLLVESNSKGFHVERVEDKMGQKPCPATALYFDDVFVPSDMVVLEGGDAPKISRVILGLTRGPVGGIATGIAKGALKKALSLLSPEEIEDEFLSQKLSTAFAKLYSARLLWINSCIESDFYGVMRIPHIPYIKFLSSAFGKIQDIFGKTFTSYLGRKLGEKIKNMFFNLVYQNIRKIESMNATAKFYATDTAFDVCRIAMEIVGEKAVEKENELERFLRDVKLTQIYETANEVNKIIVYRNLVGVGTPSS